MKMLEFPRPISVNKLHANVAGRGRVSSGAYNVWKRHVKDKLMEQLPLPQFVGAVRIHYQIGESGVSANFDLGNAEKPLTDALVRHGVIPDDRRKYVKSISLEWVPDKDGVSVFITHADEPFMAIIPIEGTIS